MTSFEMPKERLFGWELKPTSSTYFDVHTKPNGQLNVVLNHSLVRGCTAEMIYWWFQHFPTMEVLLEDIEGYEGKRVPAYWLWHPTDHHSATLGGKTKDGKMTSGSTLRIREAMNYKVHGMQYALDSTMQVPYLGPDGMTLNRRLPLLEDLVYARIHFKDVTQGSEILGVHYHYEIIAGLGGMGFVSKAITKKIKQQFSAEFFKAWHTHNAIEVGVFENFLPGLWAQRDDLSSMRYAKSMNPDLPSPATQTGYSKELFEQRLAGYAEADNAFKYLQPTDPTFLV